MVLLSTFGTTKYLCHFFCRIMALMENVNSSFDVDEFKKQHIVPSNYKNNQNIDKTLTKVKVEVTVKVLCLCLDFLKLLAASNVLTVSRIQDICWPFDYSLPPLIVARPFEQPCRSSMMVALLMMQRVSVVQRCSDRSHCGRFELYYFLLYQ